MDLIFEENCSNYLQKDRMNNHPQVFYMILWEQMNQAYACDVVPVGEGRDTRCSLRSKI